MMKRMNLLTSKKRDKIRRAEEVVQVPCKNEVATCGPLRNYLANVTTIPSNYDRK